MKSAAWIADPLTHIKIVALALVAASAVTAVAVCARVNDAGTTAARRLPPSPNVARVMTMHPQLEQQGEQQAGLGRRSAFLVAADRCTAAGSNCTVE